MAYPRYTPKSILSVRVYKDVWIVYAFGKLFTGQTPPRLRCYLAKREHTRFLKSLPE